MNKSYLVYTIEFQKRLREHNGQCKAGARNTRHETWRLVALLDSIATRSEAMSIEWHVKRKGEVTARKSAVNKYK